MSFIALNECEHGYVYKIRSRNLSMGVFNKESNGFIGIRLKFKYEFLFTEYHWDTGASLGGTVKPIEIICKLPEDIEIKETLDTIDEKSKRQVNFKEGWYYVDNGEYDKNIRPICVHNEKLFNYLKSLETKIHE